MNDIPDRQTRLIETLHARVFADSVSVRGHRHGSWLVELLAGQVPGIPGAAVSDFTREARDILDALEAKGLIAKDPRGKPDPTHDQKFFGLGGAPPGSNGAHHPAAWWWVRPDLAELVKKGKS